VDDPITVNRWSYDGLRRLAERYLAEVHAAGTLPIPIEEIVDLNLQIDVVPMEGLREWGVDAFTAGDRQTIYVDRGVYSHGSPNRLRFSLAHELAHILLHKKVFEAATFTDVQGWKVFIASVPDDQYRWIEWQAYSLAGLLLVPSPELEEQFGLTANELEQHGVDVRNLTSPGYLQVAKRLGDVFAVSSNVIDKRAVRDGIWGDDAIIIPE
jgi:hypothetical protein